MEQGKAEAPGTRSPEGRPVTGGAVKELVVATCLLLGVLFWSDALLAWVSLSFVVEWLP
ncbi:MAG: hypothetical protein OXU20_33710 [Myxococcales bacterium]|nr:hypothetical protein [Myxococcales bacterium]